VEVGGDGNTVTLTSLGHEKSPDFIFGQLCNYEVVWPAEAKNDDKLFLTAMTLAEGA